MNTTRIKTAAVLTVASVLMFYAVQAQLPETRRAERERHDLSMTKSEIIRVRVDPDLGSVFPGRMHPREEIIYVLEHAPEKGIAGGNVNGEARTGYVLTNGKPLVVFAE